MSTFNRVPNWLRYALGLPQSGVPGELGNYVHPVLDVGQGGWADAESDTYTELIIGGVVAANTDWFLLFNTPSGAAPTGSVVPWANGQARLHKVLMALEVQHEAGPTNIEHYFWIYRAGVAITERTAITDPQLTGVLSRKAYIGPGSKRPFWVCDGSWVLGFRNVTAMVATDGLKVRCVWRNAAAGYKLY